MRIDGSQATSLRNSHMFLKHLDTWSPAHGIMIAISKNSRHAKMWSLGHYRPRSTGRIVRRRTHPTAACEGGRVCLYQVPSPAVKDRRTSCPSRKSRTEHDLRSRHLKQTPMISITWCRLRIWGKGVRIPSGAPLSTYQRQYRRSRGRLVGAYATDLRPRVRAGDRRFRRNAPLAVPSQEPLFPYPSLRKGTIC
jgi:hypothetical protein